VSFYDWMFALHLIAAFAVASSLVLFSVLVWTGRRMTTLEQTRTLFRVAPVGGILISGGLAIVVGLGVYLAIASNRYELWDLWVIAAIVLAVAFGGIGQRSGAYYTDVQKLAEQPGASGADVLARLQAPTGARLHLATVILFVLIVLDMVFKPGA
jgi:hypothetical protein